jgi:polygalacturonase
MGPQKKLLLASIVAMSFFPYMLHGANSEEFFADSADGPTAAESPGDPWLSPEPQPWVVDVDDYGAGAPDSDDTEVMEANLFFFSGLPGAAIPLCSAGACSLNFLVTVYAAQAFLAAWSDACNSSEYSSTFLVPEAKTYQLMPVSFRGPCRAVSITALVRRLIDAS